MNNLPARVRLKDALRLNLPGNINDHRSVSVPYYNHHTIQPSEPNTLNNQLQYENINRRPGYQHQQIPREMLNSSFSEEFRNLNRPPEQNNLLPYDANRRSSSHHVHHRRFHRQGNDYFLPVSYSEYRSQMNYQHQPENPQFDEVKNEMIANNFWPTGPDLAQKESKTKFVNKKAFLRIGSPVLKLPTRNQSEGDFFDSSQKRPQNARVATEHLDNSMNHSSYFEKKKLPNSEELVDSYARQIELNHRTLDFLKSYTRCTTKL